MMTFLDPVTFIIDLIVTYVVLLDSGCHTLSKDTNIDIGCDLKIKSCPPRAVKGPFLEGFILMVPYSHTAYVTSNNRFCKSFYRLEDR